MERNYRVFIRYWVRTGTVLDCKTSTHLLNSRNYMDVLDYASDLANEIRLIENFYSIQLLKIEDLGLCGQ